MIKIAYVDDSPMQREIVSEWLEEYSSARGTKIECDTFENSDEIITSAKACGGYDIYILDIVLPGMKGTDIADEVKLIRADSKIIFLTATVAFESKVEAFGYFVKPIRSEQLFELLDKALA